MKAGDRVAIMTPENEIGYIGTYVGPGGGCIELITPDDPGLEDPMEACFDCVTLILEQMLVIYEGEDVDEVARGLIGIKGTAMLQRVVHEPGAPWPTAIYTGTRQQLAAVAAKASGSPIGRPPKTT